MKNKYEIRGDVTVIFVKFKGELYETMIDTEDLEKVDFHPNTWKINKRKSLPYVVGSNTLEKRRIYFRLHRYIMNPPDEMTIDHINHNTFDNRKCNLRIATNQENLKNRRFKPKDKKIITNVISRKKPSGIKSGVKGIHWSERHRVWVAKHRIKSKTIFEKQYKIKEDAIYALNKFKESIN